MAMWLVALALVVLVALAMVAYHCVEGAFHRWGPRWLRQPRWAAAVLLPAVVATAGWLLVFCDTALAEQLHWRALDLPARGIRYPRFDFNVSHGIGECICDAASGRALYLPAGASLDGSECEATSPPCFSLAAFAEWRATLAGTGSEDATGHATATRIFPWDARRSRAIIDEAMGSGVTQPRERERMLFAIGDSKSMALVYGLVAAVWGRMRVMDWAAPGHPYTDPIKGWPWNRMDPPYVRTVTETLAEVLRPADIVFVHARGAGVVGSEELAALQVRQLRTLLAITRARAATLVVATDFGDLPMTLSGGEHLRGYRCNAAPWSAATFAACRQPCTMLRNESRARNAPAKDALVHFARDEAGVHLFTLDELMCAGDLCSTIIPGTSSAIGIGDYKHLTPLGAFYLWPHIRGFLWDRGLL